MQQQSHDPAVRNDGNLKKRVGTLERSFLQAYLGTDTGLLALSSFSPASGSEDMHEHGETWLPENFTANELSRLYTRHAACRLMLGRVECPAVAESCICDQQLYE